MYRGVVAFLTVSAVTVAAWGATAQRPSGTGPPFSAARSRKAPRSVLHRVPQHRGLGRRRGV